MHTRRPGQRATSLPLVGRVGGRRPVGWGYRELDVDEVGIRAAINSQWRAGGLSCQSKSPAHFVNVAGRSECAEPTPTRPASGQPSMSKLRSSRPHKRRDLKLFSRSKILLASYDRRSGQSDKRNCDEWISVEKPTHEETKRNDQKAKNEIYSNKELHGTKSVPDTPLRFCSTPILPRCST